MPARSTGADVSDIAVHCAPPAPPAGPRSDVRRRRQGVDAGRRRARPRRSSSSPTAASSPPAVGAVSGGIDFALTRHDADGKLDTGFGDRRHRHDRPGQRRPTKAFDAALHRDGGFVVVGRTDGPGFNRNFAVVRYHADGDPRHGFGGDGIVTTDFAGPGRPGQRGRRATRRQDRRRRARRQDGAARRRQRLRDRPLPRRRRRSTRASAADGIVTTDLGTRTDIGRAVAIQPGDGGIVVAGTTEDDVALVRYAADGEPRHLLRRTAASRSRTSAATTSPTPSP